MLLADVIMKLCSMAEAEEQGKRKDWQRMKSRGEHLC